MSSSLRRRLVWGCLQLARMPSLPRPIVDPETAAAFAVAADGVLAGEAVTVPEPRLDFLCWLAENRDVVFHGSPWGGSLWNSRERGLCRSRRRPSVAFAIR